MEELLALSGLTESTAAGARLAVVGGCSGNCGCGGAGDGAVAADVVLTGAAVVSTVVAITCRQQGDHSNIASLALGAWTLHWRLIARAQYSTDCSPTCYEV